MRLKFEMGKMNLCANRQLLIALAVALPMLVAVVGCSSSEPPLTPAATISPDPEVNRIMAGSCYSCHTTEGSEEWVAKMQPSRWFGHDPALEQLNFSQWDLTTRKSVVIPPGKSRRRSTTTRCRRQDTFCFIPRPA